jgi:hypothetical protein
VDALSPARTPPLTWFWGDGLFVLGTLVEFCDLRGTKAAFSKNCWRAVVAWGLLSERESRHYGVPSGWRCFAIHRDIYVQSYSPRTGALNPAFAVLSRGDVVGRRVVIQVDLEARSRRKGAGGGYVNYFAFDADVLGAEVVVGPGLGLVPGVLVRDQAGDRRWCRV